MRKCVACGITYWYVNGMNPRLFWKQFSTWATSKMNGRQFSLLYFRVIIGFIENQRKPTLLWQQRSIKMMTSPGWTHFLGFAMSCGLFRHALYSVFCCSIVHSFRWTITDCSFRLLSPIYKQVKVDKVGRTCCFKRLFSQLQMTQLQRMIIFSVHSLRQWNSLL